MNSDLSINNNMIKESKGIIRQEEITNYVFKKRCDENEKRIVEICDSLSIGAAIENMILTATGYGLGTLWIANTCFAYNELMDFIGTDSQLTGIVAVGFADEAPDKRPRKPFEEIVEYRQVNRN